MANLHALPLPYSRTPSATTEENPQRRKRKRGQSTGADLKSDRLEAPIEHNSESDEATEEYRAVLDPDERTQRRLAHYSFRKPLPDPPFPHKDILPTTQRKTRSANKRDPESETEESLRVQHISAMTAILHRSVQGKDWTRARRALGLLLRTEIAGQSLDIRAADMWGIGAEILLRQYAEPGRSYSFSGFQAAKDYYETLIIRYPYDRNVPDSTNSIDFYLAMFSLWIYVTQAERDSRQDEQDDGLLHDALTQELHEAAEISARLRKVTAQAPFSDNKDLIRLKADVEHWQANLQRDHRLYSPITGRENPLEERTAATADQQLSLRPASFQSAG